MHVLFTENEKAWIMLRTFGWPIKTGCPDEIRQSIQRKKRILESQKENISYGDKYDSRSEVKR